jgi:signal transduction histidine kinase
MSPRIDERTVIRALAIGFSIVILLLATAAFMATRRSHAIRAAASELLREQRAVTTVVDELQLEQQRMSTLLFHLFDGDLDSAQLRSRADRLEAEIRSATDQGARIEPHAAWAQLQATGEEFSGSIRELLSARARERDAIENRLEDTRAEFARLCNEVVLAQKETAAKLEAQIQQQSVELIRESGWLLGACLLLSITGAAATIRITQRSFRTMEWQAEELNRVSWHMLQTQEAAARRFSHEMHDELGQALTALKTNLAAMTPEDLARRRLDSMRLLDEAIGKVRELSQLLHPVILDDFGIQAGLRWLADGFSERTRIEVECKTDIPGRFSDDTERHLFRITQEALTNIARHSGATRAWIRLTEAGDGISLTIEDNGCGFNPEKMRRPSLGMVGMRARARQIGGELTVGTSSTGGVKLEVRAPKKEADKDAAEEDTRVAG